MLGLLRWAKACVAIALVGFALGGAAQSQSQTTGSIRISGTSVGFIVGGGGGQGILRFRGNNYPLSVSGISIGTIGVSQSDLVGVAYHLRKPSDIAGTYSAIGAGIAVVGGARVARLRNGNGVVLELHGEQVGFQLSAGLGGLTLTML